MESALVLTSDAPSATRALGRVLGSAARPGDCLALVGDLGAGKTTLAAGLGEGLEVTEPLRSPTYLLCHEHVGRLPVLHLDAYFAERMEGLLLEGLAARFGEDVVLVLEWADRLTEWWPRDRLEVVLEAVDATSRRRLRFRPLGPRARDLLRRARTGLLAAADDGGKP